jgi:hypothetical protein
MERLALEFLFVVELVLVVFEFARPLRRIVLAQPRADCRLDRAHLQWAQRRRFVIDQLKLIDIAWRLRIDRSCHVGRRPFGWLGKLNAADMLNSRLARHPDFAVPL